MAVIRRLTILVWIMWLWGCGTENIQGSGAVITEPRVVSGFRSISLTGSGRLIINQTGNESLTITADDNLLPHLIAEVRGSQLVLGVAPRTNVNPTETIIYRLDVGKIDEVELSGTGELEALGLVADSFRVVASGSTRMMISGQADSQEINISGAGEYEAPDFRSREVSITITGSGQAVVAASEILDVTVTGAGSIEYIGDPAVTQTITGSGTIRKR